MRQDKTVINRICKDFKGCFPILVLIGLYIVVMNLTAGKVCPVRILTGLPCPGCGISRSLWLLCQGNITGSIRIHPMGIFMIPGIFFGCYERYGPCRRKWGQTYLIIWCIASVGVYIIRMVFLYPCTEPMVYDSENLFQCLMSLMIKYKG